MCFCWQKWAKAKVAYQKIGEKLDSSIGKNQLLPQSNLKKLFPGSLVVFRSRVGQKPNESVSNHDRKKLVVSLNIPSKIDCCQKRSVCLGSIFGPKASPPKKKWLVVANNLTWRMPPLPNLGCLCLFTCRSILTHTFFGAKWTEVSCNYKKSSKTKKNPPAKLVSKQFAFISCQANPPPETRLLQAAEAWQVQLKSTARPKTLRYSSRSWTKKSRIGFASGCLVRSRLMRLRNPRLNQLSLAVFVLPFTRFYTSFRWFPESVNHD